MLGTDASTSFASANPSLLDSFSCCASGFNMPQDIKRWSNLTLLCLVGMLVVQVIYVIGAVIGLTNEAVNNEGQISTNSINVATTGALVVGIVSWVLNVLAFVFACLFTWKRS